MASTRGEKPAALLEEPKRGALAFLEDACDALIAEEARAPCPF
jgi:hypothetical protein